MESIERLREYLDENTRKLPHTEWIANEPMEVRPSRIYGYIDEIEREVDDMWHALTIDAKPMTDENMAESGWVRLPVDADGVPIHVGDWITGKWDAKAKVVAITSEDVYWWEPDGCHWCHSNEVAHHHAPTVEDVLEQFLTAYDDADEGQLGITTRDVIAKYAAKLRLVGDE